MKIVINGESVEVNGDAVPQDSSGGGEVYSTEETRIGTWIDGKPLYRKCVEFTASVANAWTNVLPLIPNADMKMVDAFIARTTGDFTRVGQLGGVLSSIMYNVGSGSEPNGLNYWTNHSTMLGQWTAILSYTKTTD